MNYLDFSHIKIQDILTITFALFAVIDILGSIPILISLKNKMGGISASRATWVSGGLILLFFFFGEVFLKVLGLGVKDFAMAGSIVLFLIALEMVLGLEIFKGDNNPKAGSVVPIAFPLIAGSGTLTTVMSMKSIYHYYNILIAIIVNLIFVYLTLTSINYIEKKLGPGGILVIRKFFGVILIAIAVKIFKSSL
jgi:multiple antibiotic resistance protein